MKKVIFINPPQPKSAGYGRFSVNVIAPIGLCSLAAVTRQAGYDTFIIDGVAMQFNNKEIVEIIARENPQYVGITATSCSITAAFYLAHEIKERGLICKVILGGAHLSAIPELTMESCSSIDIGVIGEGEITILELLSALEKGIGLEGVKGIIFRKNDEFYLTEARPPIEDLDSLPFPSWDLLQGFPKKYRPAPQYFLNLPSGTLVTSRGCPGRCLFCCKSIYQRGYSQHSSAYVFRSIKQLVGTYGIKDIFFFDDTFLADNKRTAEICDELLKNDVRISWSCFARSVDIKDPMLMKLIKKSGCYQISLGIESADPRIRKILRKQGSVEQNERAIDMINRAGIRTHGFFIVGSPGENRESLQKTADFIKDKRLNSVQVSFFTPYPGSDAYEVIDKYGTVVKTGFTGKSLWMPSFIPKDITQKELIYYYNSVLRRFYFNPIRLFKYLCNIILRPAHIVDYLKACVSIVGQILDNNNISKKDAGTKPEFLRD